MVLYVGFAGRSIISGLWQGSGQPVHRLGIEAWRRDCGPAPHTLLIRLDGILGRIAPDPAYKVDEQQTLPRLLANISESMEMAITAWLGIDIAKQKFDVTLNWNSRRRAKVFRNDAEGWQALLRWLKDLGVDQVHAGLEATGRYGDGLALHLHDAGHRVSVVNPAQIKHFGRAKLGRNKTDRADAALICDYCRLFEPAAWTPPSAALRELRDLVRTREALTASRVECGA